MLQMASKKVDANCLSLFIKGLTVFGRVSSRVHIGLAGKAPAGLTKKRKF